MLPPGVAVPGVGVAVVVVVVVVGGGGGGGGAVADYHVEAAAAAYFDFHESYSIVSVAAVEERRQVILQCTIALGFVLSP